MRVYLQGGLGNQLFQLAFVGHLNGVGKRVTIDTSLLDHPPDGTTVREFWLGDLLKDERLSSSRSRVRWVQAGVPLLARAGLAFVDEGEDSWRSVVDRRLIREAVGYFQDPSLIEEEWPWLRERFHQSEKWEALVSSPLCRRVCMHYRLGDYVSSSHHGVTHPSFFERAVQEFRAMQGPCEIVVVSDSPSLAAQLLEGIGNSSGCSVKFLAGGDEMADLLLLSTSSHVVVSNSSFSWWGGYFASRKGATVVAPTPWLSSGDLPLSGVPGWRVRQREIVDVRTLSDPSM